MVSRTVAADDAEGPTHDAVCYQPRTRRTLTRTGRTRTERTRRLELRHLGRTIRSSLSLLPINACSAVYMSLHNRDVASIRPTSKIVVQLLNFTN